MGERGQITIEAILIFGMFILLFVGVTFPHMLTVYRHSNDASAVLEGKNNLNAIANAIILVRNGGPGTVKTVPITSSIKNWGLRAYESGHTLVYAIEWGNADKVPGQLIQIGTMGGIGIETIDGINSTGAASGYDFSSDDGQGKWYVKIENNATSSTPIISIDGTLENGDTIKVTIV
jgi:uncharacterized protein (UPF0333 family)